MSEVYIKEPATKGAAVFHTTHGDLEVELWATECPKACRNFCQLILEGYYNGNSFHRVIKDFIIQTGDKTDTGDGSESIYGKPYDDEIHPRLKFRYRGMMGIASAGPNTKTNGSQFFIVMNRAPSLDRKHTLFGKVVGQTIYNLVRLTEVEVDKHDRPVDPPRIIRAELTWDPFGDLEPRFVPAPIATSKGLEKHRREAIKNKRVLSFGGGDEEDSNSDDDGKASFKPSFGKARSAHDALRDSKPVEEAPKETPRKREAPKIDKSLEPPTSSRDALSGVDARAADCFGVEPQRSAKAARRKAAESESDAEKEEEQKENGSDGEDSSSSSGSGGGKKLDPSQKRNEEMLRLKREIVDTRKGEAPAPAKVKKKSAWEELLSGFKTRAQNSANKPKDKKGRQAQTAAIGQEVSSFKDRVRQAEEKKGAEDKVDSEVMTRKEKAEDGSLAAVWEEGEDESTTDWLSGGGLEFSAGKDRAFKLASTSKENLAIFDPLAGAGDAELLEMARKRRSDQLKPSLRRSGLNSLTEDSTKIVTAAGATGSWG